MDKKKRTPGILKLNDFDLLNWILAQEYHWRQGLDKLSNAQTLQELVDFVRNNYHTIKTKQHEKTRINREA